MGATNFTRRNFVKGGLVGGSLVAMAGLAACSPASPEDKLSDTGSETEELVADEEVETDIVIVGAGGGGLAAAVEAAEKGASVIVLEANDKAGGNFDLTIGLMGVNSSMTKEEDRVDPMQIVATEVANAQYSVDSMKWKDLVDASAGNIDWLVDHGCKLTPPVAYLSDFAPVVYHMWPEGFTPASALIPAAEKAGAQFLLSTRGKQLITDDNGAVVGIFAERKDGSILKVTAKAVILATGGWVNDEERMDRFAKGQHYYVRGAVDRPGDGIRMANEVGAHVTADQFHVMGWPALWIEHDMAWYNALLLSTQGEALWVNQDGYRFTNEGLTRMMSSGPIIHAFLSQKQTYTICDAGIADPIPGDLNPDTSVRQMLDGAVEDGETRIWRADTFEELFQKAGVDSEVFLATVEQYNRDCENGRDSMFGKDASMLTKIATPPFYLVENTFYVSATMANIDYDRSMRVVDLESNPISGLYVAGVDGAQLYKSFYCLETAGGSCNANNIYSGRTAAQTAIEDFSL